MKLSEALRKSSKSVGPMLPGENAAFVFSNATILFMMGEGQDLKIVVTGVRPEDVSNEAIDDLFEEIQ